MITHLRPFLTILLLFKYGFYKPVMLHNSRHKNETE
jgi:hypothetical protein